MIILVDTREKANSHILEQFSKQGIEYKLKKLDYGDYSFELDGESYQEKIVIERKGSLTEIAGNFTKGRDRFKREFERAMQVKCKVFLMIENGSIEQIEKGDYRSRFSPSAFKGSLSTWCYKYQIKLEFIEKRNAASFIISAFKKYIQEGSKDE